MTYGVRLENPSGRLVLNSEAPTPRLLGKMGLESGSSELIAPDFYLARYVYVGALNPRNIYAMTVPETTGGPAWWAGVRYIPATYNASTNRVVVEAFYRSGANPIAPEVYAFGTDYVPAGSGAWGFQLRDRAGGITFDSNARHLMLRDVVARPPNGGTVTLQGMPSKPAFILPSGYIDRRTYFYEQDGQDDSRYISGLDVDYEYGCYRRLGTDLSFSYAGTSQRWYGASSDYAGEWYFGTNNDYAAMVMIDAALYD